MTFTEGDKKPKIETPGRIELPGRVYDLRELADKGFEHLAVGLALLRHNPESGGLEVLMGHHRAADRLEEQVGRWSWPAETVAETEAGKDIDDTLARLVAEEMERGLTDLDLRMGTTAIYETDLIKEGRRFMTPIFVFWTEQDLQGRLSESEEIDFLQFVSVDGLLSGEITDMYPLREFTMPGLHQLADQGVFRQRSEGHLRVNIPVKYSTNGWNPTRRLDLSKFKSL